MNARCSPPFEGRQQNTFLLQYGVLDRDFDYDGWIDRRPLEHARRELDEARAA